MSVVIGKLEYFPTHFPTLPGCYLMKDAQGEVLYVGKAKNLRARVRQYFGAGRDERPQVPFLMAQVASIDTIVVGSEKEALLLENTLIKRHLPKYNMLLKDDKGYISLRLTHHEWPMIELVRLKGAAPKDATYFGPYTAAHAARQMFDLIRSIFPLRQCSDEEFRRRTRPCLLYQIKKCSAPCVGYVSKETYQSYVSGATALLRGHTQELIRELAEAMEKASAALEFEMAGKIFQKIQLIKEVVQAQQVTLSTVRDMDVWGLFQEGRDVVITKLMWRASALVGSHHFDVSVEVQQPEELFESLLMQHYLAERADIPDVILLGWPVGHTREMMEIFSERRGKKVEVEVPKRGQKRELIQLALTNAEAAFRHRKDRQELSEKALLELQESLGLSRYPHRVECFDSSHFAGSERVSALVTFVDGEKATSGYRRFLIRTVATGDDLAMLEEALLRRYSKTKDQGQIPDLIIVDGGKTHLRVALATLARLNIVSSEVIAIAKEASRHDRGLTREQIHTSGRSEPYLFDRHAPALLLLQKIRDEAHRFAHGYQKLRRRKQLIKSALDDIPGIGPVKKRRLLTAFGSVKAIAGASIEALCQVPGISSTDAVAILDHLSRA